MKPNRLARLRRGPLVALAGLAACLTTFTGCGPLRNAMRGYAEARSVELAAIEASLPPDAPRRLLGQARFAFDDFGVLDTDLLETYGLPWKLAAAALVQRRHDEDGAPLNRATLRRSLAGFGFVRPRRIVNWDGPPPGRLERPIGLLSGQASRGFPRVELEVAGIGCAACHAGTTYDAEGRPTGNAWLGLPNSSLDVDAYGDSLVVALRVGLQEPERILRSVRALFPSVDERELETLRKHVIPRAREEIADLDATGERRLPFTNGGPGTANGVASTQHLLSFPVAEPGRVAFTSIPYIGDRHLRSSLLADGLYAVPGAPRFRPQAAADDPEPDHLDGLAGIMALFVVPAMGGKVSTAQAAVPAMEDVVRYLASLEPPPFPGPVDSTLALKGRKVYAARCARCHGATSEGLGDVRIAAFPNRLVPLARIDTDSSRLRGAENAPLDRLGAVGFDEHATAAATGGYMAPPLSAVWATAPYLHNGSVPTLWHLMNPDERPERFEVGGHALDFTRLGVAGLLDADGVYRMPDGYRPWSTPRVYDTRLPGRGNGGHTRPFEGLSPHQKRALLEYLKVL